MATTPRRFNPLMDSVIYRQLEDLARHLGVPLPDALKRELGPWLENCEAEMKRRTQEFMERPAPPIWIPKDEK